MKINFPAFAGLLFLFCFANVTMAEKPPLEAFKDRYVAAGADHQLALQAYNVCSCESDKDTWQCMSEIIAPTVAICQENPEQCRGAQWMATAKPCSEGDPSCRTAVVIQLVREETEEFIYTPSGPPEYYLNTGNRSFYTNPILTAGTGYVLIHLLH